MSLKFEKAKLYLITDQKQRLYFTGYNSTDGYLLLDKTGKTLVIDSRYFHACSGLLEPKGIKVVLGGDYTYLKERIEKEHLTELGVDFDKITARDYEYFKGLGVTPVDVAHELELCMTIKTKDELENIRKACEIAEKAFYETLPSIKKGVTEREVANILEFNFKKLGASGVSFETIVAFGKNAAIPHHETGDDVLCDDECVLMDFGCLYNGYCSDMTRTMFYGTPDDEFIRSYDAVLEAHLKALNEIKSGMNGYEADKIARDVLKKYGLDKYFTHSLGHGIGVNIHEYPRLSPKSDTELKDNMVFSDEPGVYFNDKFGIRIEDSCYLENGKTYSFMKSDKNLIILK